MKLKLYSIVLADDHAMFRQGIKHIIEKIEGVHISGEVDDGEALLDCLKTTTPDLVVLDIAMPRLRGLEALREIKKHYPHIKILILTMHGNQEFIRQAVADGAEGFILKEEQSSELIRGIKAIREGSTYFSPKLSKTLKDMIIEKDQSDYLTWREQEVLRHLARGLNTQEVSEALYISIHTVRRHRYNIMHKLNLRSTTELVKYAIAQGLAD